MVGGGGGGGGGGGIILPRLKFKFTRKMVPIMGRASS